MTQEPTTDSETPDREAVFFWTRVRRGALLMVSAVLMYLLMTGPLIWSYSRFDNDAWQSFVKLAITPIIKFDAYEKRDYVSSLKNARNSYADGAMCVMIDPSPGDSWWLSGLHSYWSLYGRETSFRYDLLSFLSFIESE